MQTMLATKPKILVIVGPTASGKTSLSIKVAKRFSGEIVSADSRQVYKRLDVGTAKVTKEEMAGIPHHLIDIFDISKIYTVADFKSDASVVIKRILNRNNLPIIAGGTFFYVDALLGKTPISEVPPDEKLRAELEKKEIKSLYAALLKLDPRRAADIDPDNKRRIIRSLEIIAELGAVPQKSVQKSRYNVLTIGIKTNKEDLRERFRDRANEWLNGGFREEVEGLLANNVTRERLQEIGFEYMLILELIDGDLNEDSFIQKFNEKNWQYAKRQGVWLKRDKSIVWVDPTDYDTVFSTIQEWQER